MLVGGFRTLPTPLTSLEQLHVVGGEHPEVAVRAVAPPPPLVDHLNVGDDVLRVKGDLGVIRRLVVVECAGTQPLPRQLWLLLVPTRVLILSSIIVVLRGFLVDGCAVSCILIHILPIHVSPHGAHVVPCS